jgi:hypothetical protein
MDTNKVQARVRLIAEALFDNAHRFTCSEAEAVCDLFAEVGLGGLVDGFRTRHAEEDEVGDLHKVVDGVGVFCVF